MTKARTLADNFAADINGITAGTGITGGGTSGTVTVTNEMATIIDAKGDLVAGTGADTFARLAVGTNGDTLVADSSTSTGLRYTAGTVQSNPVLNSAFQVWQRGTSIAQTAAFMYSADRWCSSRAGLDVGTTMSRQVTNDTTNLPNIQYCARVQRNSGTTATTGVFFSQTMESINSIPYAGKTITFSFYARKGADYSSASDALSITVSSGTGTDQNILSTYTGAASAIGGSQTATLTATWQRFNYTGTVAAAATQLGFFFNYTPVGTAGAADFFEVTGVQIDVGSVALPFRTYAATIQGELAACQRYYYRKVCSANFGVFGLGFAVSTTAVQTHLQFPVSMRTRPTAIESGGTVYVNDGVTSTTVTSLAINVDWITNTETANFRANVASGLTQYRPYTLGADAANTSYVAFSAEL
jgi:hypothetical protein